MASILAAELRGRVLTPDYRLAPEHRFPAAVDDAVAAYDAVLGTGLTPNKVALGGDSAGGGLVLATLLAARDGGLPLPAAAVCVSPWADLTTSPTAPSIMAAADPQVTPGRLSEMAAWYLGDADPASPLASPARSDLSGLPPLLVQVGAAEGLLDDARLVTANARQAGVDVTFECWDDMIHVWHAFAPRLEEGTAALQRIAGWLAQHWDAA
jgi:epsilon-lactone hydrolase